MSGSDLRGIMGLSPEDGHETLLAILKVPQSPPPHVVRPDLAAMTPDALELVLAEQVGPKWTGLGATSIERRIAFEAVGGRLVPETSLEHACAAVAGRHAHETGVLLALAADADMTGGMTAWGFASPPEDPVLRAIITCFGRPTIPLDAYGAVAHWIAEKGKGEPIGQPHVSVAARHLHAVLAARRPVPPRHSGTSSW